MVKHLSGYFNIVVVFILGVIHNKVIPQYLFLLDNRQKVFCKILGTLLLPDLTTQIATTAIFLVLVEHTNISSSEFSDSYPKDGAQYLTTTSKRKHKLSIFWENEVKFPFLHIATTFSMEIFITWSLFLMRSQIGVFVRFIFLFYFGKIIMQNYWIMKKIRFRKLYIYEPKSM